jgi:hypothetical protein
MVDAFLDVGEESWRMIQEHSPGASIQKLLCRNDSHVQPARNICVASSPASDHPSQITNQETCGSLRRH